MEKLALALWAGLTFASAQAASIDSAADPALAGASVIDFQSAAAGGYSSLTLSGVTFSAGGGTRLYIDSYVGANWPHAYNTSGQSLRNTYAGDAFGTLTMSFSTPARAFGFNWGAADTVWLLTAYDASNSVLDERTLPATQASNAGEFFGLSASGDIAYVVLSGNRSDYVFIDNFAVAAAVPEPETYLLLGAGLLVVGLAVRRRQAR